MSLILITGLAGTGKSTIRAELVSRGFQAYDQDEDHIAKWYNDKTGKAVIGRPRRTTEFLQTHSRSILRDTAQKLAIRAKDKPIFLCGDPENDDELRDLFAYAFALKLDEATRQYRLATRTNNQYGKTPEDLAYDAENLKRSATLYKRLNYVLVDANRSTGEIVDDILAQVQLR